MELDREEIVRADFPTSRKGFSPDAVRAHLEAVAEAAEQAPEPAQEVEAAPLSLGEAAGQRVQTILERAELTAGNIEGEARTSAELLTGTARAEAEETIANAQAEADRILSGAREEAKQATSAATTEAEQATSSARVESERILSEARAEAETTRGDAESALASAREEATQVIADARVEASQRVEQARAAVEGLVDQASDLRNRVGSLGEELAGSIRSSAASVAEVLPGPAELPEPTPPTIPEPTPDPVPEPTPDPVPEPTPDPVPEPSPDPEPLPDPPEPAPGPDFDESEELEEVEEVVVVSELEDDEVDEEALATSVGPSAGAPTNEDLVDQLRSSSPPDMSGSNEGSAPPPSPPDASDLGSIRLVAMNMALEGKPRDEAAQRLEGEFGQIEQLDEVLDDIFGAAEV